METHTAPQRLVLILSSRQEFVAPLKRLLGAFGFSAVSAGASVEAALEVFTLSAVVVDAADSPANALCACEALNHSDVEAPALLLVKEGDAETLARASRLGISNFAEEPCTPEVLVARVEAIARSADAVTEDRENANRIQRHMNQDGLTGLSNRRSFLENVNRMLERAGRNQRNAAVLYLDVDRFKGVNDALGHSVGDALLKHVARILDDHVRPTDMIEKKPAWIGADVSRLGGDEFTVLLSEITHGDAAGDVAHRILEAIKIPFSADGYQLVATASIGIAIYPDDGEDAEALLRSADMAMYAAKAQARGCFCFYQSEMGQNRNRRLEVERQLGRAIENGELEVRYQPRIDFAKARICGMEALVRWRSPELGEVQPNEFIPIAEESGLITSLGAWVLETACAQLAQWRREGLDGLRISVNVSSREFESSDVVKTVTDTLRSTGVAPHALELEITERVMLGGDERVALALRDLRGIGVKMALDDFGTGYSSLNYITRYPLDILKIDRSIAADVEENPAAGSIVAAVVMLGRSLGLSIVAEGVDSLEQARVLTDLGCDEIQGFLFAPALTVAEFSKFYRSWKGVEQDSYSEKPLENSASEREDMPTPIGKQ
jgi:diguanylate cyclase (GGDEF)-like protein